LGYSVGELSPGGMSASLIRSAVIFSFALAIYFLLVIGLSDLPRVLAFIGLVAGCFYFVMKAAVDILTWTFCLLTKYSGKGLGHLVVLVRRTGRRLRTGGS
jgi:hypothetical protein